MTRPVSSSFVFAEELDDTATLEQLLSFDATLCTTVLTEDAKEAIDNAAKDEEVLAALETESEQS